MTHTGTPYERNGRSAPQGQRGQDRADEYRAHTEAWWETVRGAAAVFARQVLLRPLRIGTLVLLAAAVVAVVTGAEGWWIILGVVLFQTAGSSLIVLWTDGEPDQPDQPDQPEPRRSEPDTTDEESEPPEPLPEPDVPGQRPPGEE